MPIKCNENKLKSIEGENTNKQTNQLNKVLKTGLVAVFIFKLRCSEWRRERGLERERT